MGKKEREKYNFVMLAITRKKKQKKKKEIGKMQ